MKKVLVVFTVLVVLCTLFISVSADSSLPYFVGPFDQFVVSKSDGSVDLIASVEVSNGVFKNVTYEYSFDLITWHVITKPDGTPAYGIHLNRNVPANFQDFYIRAVGKLENSLDLVYSDVAFIDVNEANLSNFILAGLKSSISWVGSLISSLTSGPLSGLLPILAIGISVAALLVVIKIIKLFGWGA